MKLQEAISIIESSWKLGNRKQVVMIEYEDGSQVKFNYKLYGETITHHADLSTPASKMDALNEIAKWIDVIDDKSQSKEGRDYAKKRMKNAFKFIIN